MGVYNHWRIPIMGWSFDEFQTFRTTVFSITDFDNYLSNYRDSYRDKKIGELIFDLPINFNLGGKEEKTRLMTTDRPLGVFDFSLASKGLYKVPEYYSQELADDKPYIFKELNLPKGVVPPDLVATTKINGKSFFTFTDVDGITYNLTQQQKGTAAISQGVPNAKKQFATTTKKVYLKFNKQGGKVKYIEIYSLFYFSRGGGDTEYAIAHLPALQVAEYFESRGIGVRFYMTRFVVIDKGAITLRQNDLRSNYELPLYKESVRLKKTNISKFLLFQPIQVKDFYQELDMSELLAVSSDSQSQTLYETIARASLENEIIDGRLIYPFGSPDWQQIEYFEAFERYRNKYARYIKDGIWKSKEVTAEGQMFFHSISIKYYLNQFTNIVRDSNNSDPNIPFVGNRIYDFLSVNPVAQKFFEFWMKLCGFRLKHIILLQISQNLRKDLTKCIDESKEAIDSITYYLQNQISQNNRTAIGLMSIFYNILSQESYPMNVVGTDTIINYKGYVVNILQDAQVYAEKGYFPTPQEEIDKREERVMQILDELNNL